MSNYLHNMGCPTRSFVNYSFQKLNDKYIIISPGLFAKMLGCSLLNVYEELTKYINLHKDEINNKFIDEYIIVKAIPCNYPFAKGDSDNTISLMKEYDISTTPSINLLISILGRIVSDLYIPNRDIEINEDKLKWYYIIPMEK